MGIRHPSTVVAIAISLVCSALLQDAFAQRPLRRPIRPRPAADVQQTPQATVATEAIRLQTTKTGLAPGYRFVQQSPNQAVVYRENNSTGVTVACACNDGTKGSCAMKITMGVVYCVGGTCKDCKLVATVPQGKSGLAAAIFRAPTNNPPDVGVKDSAAVQPGRGIRPGTVVQPIQPPQVAMESIRIQAKRVALAPGYTFVRQSPSQAVVYRGASSTKVNVSCACGFFGKGACSLTITESAASCSQGTCTSSCNLVVSLPQGSKAMAAGILRDAATNAPVIAMPAGEQSAQPGLKAGVRR